MYQLRSKITTSPAAGKCAAYRCTYICDFSRSVGAGSATTRNTRGLTRSVIRLIVPPFPAVSRPSNTTQTLAPESFTHSCIATSSPCKILICRSYSLRFIFAGGPAPGSCVTVDDGTRAPASPRSCSSFFFFLAISLPPINGVTWALLKACGLPRTRHRNAEDAAVQTRTPAQTGDAPGVNVCPPCPTPGLVR